jgi:hypothetical protein
MVLGLPRGTAILDSSDLVSLSTRRSDFNLRASKKKKRNRCLPPLILSP